MSQLAYNEKGERFSPSETVEEWRVTRFLNSNGRGLTSPVYGPDTTPVFVDVDGTVEEFREAVGGVPGRYRLEGVDAHRGTVPGVPAAVLVVSDVPAPRSTAGTPPPTSSSLEYALVEIARANALAMQAITGKLGGILESVAGVVRAADGAGLPRRAPRGPLLRDDDELDDDHDDQDDDALPGGGDAGAARPELPPASGVLGQVSQLVTAATMFGTMLSRLKNEFFGGGGNANAGAARSLELTAGASTTERPPAAPPEGQGGGDVAEAVPPPEEAPSEPTPRVARPATATARPVRQAPTSHGPRAARAAAAAPPPQATDPMAHFLAVQAQLTPEEQAVVHHAIATAPVAELAQWYEQLAGQSVPDAVATIRAQLALRAQAGQTGQAGQAGASDPPKGTP